MEVKDPRPRSEEVLEALGECHRKRGETDRETLRLIVEADRLGLWEGNGHSSFAQWVSVSLGVSNWKARPLIGTGYALEKLPVTAAALASGSLSLDKTVELGRFATKDNERVLLNWAKRVSPGAIRRRADKEQTAGDEARDALASRYVRFFPRLDGTMGLEGLLPMAEGIKVRKALDRSALTLPEMPQEEDGSGPDEETSLEMRRADALCDWASAQISDDQNPDLATVVMSLSLEALANNTYGCELEGVGIHPETARRFSCECRYQVLWTGKDGDIGINRMSRNIPPALRRLAELRDESCCCFPGCERRSFLTPHHVQHWTREGPTNLGNLKMLCSTHHPLMHEGGWSVILDDNSQPIFFRPSGRRYVPDLPGTELKESVLAAQEESRAGPTPGSIEDRFGLKNFELKEMASGLSEDLYEIARSFAGD